MNFFIFILAALRVDISGVDADYSSGNMMAHYFHYLTLVNRYIFILIAGACAWLKKANNNEYWKDYWLENVADKPVPQFLYIMGSWLCVRYQYHMPFNLLLHNIVMAFEPINYLYNFVRPGIDIKVVTFYLHL